VIFIHKKIRTQADYFFGYPTAQGGASLSTRRSLTGLVLFNI
jgi:hypothetical protein